MMKKFMSILLFLFFIMPNIAFVWNAGSGNSDCDRKIGSEITFVKDYCKIAVEIKDYIKNSFAAIASSSVNDSFLYAATNQIAFYIPATYNSNIYEKFFTISHGKIFSCLPFSALPISAMFLAFIISAILLYIGLLRLFDGQYIKIKKLIIKTGFAF
jgi:hypothetical protein